MTTFLTRLIGFTVITLILLLVPLGSILYGLTTDPAATPYRGIIVFCLVPMIVFNWVLFCLSLQRIKS